MQKYTKNLKYCAKDKFFFIKRPQLASELEIRRIERIEHVDKSGDLKRRSDECVV